MDSDSQQGPSTAPASTTTAAPQIRSRITVVCAECKRLKLKCDRRNPCGSCQKRDTVSRCIYSPAAAEKVDLHSLNNRLIQVEATLAQLTSGQFTPCYPFSAPSTSSGGPPPPTSSLNSSLSPPTIQHCSLAIPFEEIGGTWLNEIELEVALPPKFAPSRAGSSNSTGYHNGGTSVKLEPFPVDLPPSVPNDLHEITAIDRPSTSSSSGSSAYPPSSLTASSPTISSPTSSFIHTTHASLPPVSAYYTPPSPPSASPAPPSKAVITPALLVLLPSLNSSSTSLHSHQSPRPQLSLLTLLSLAEESTTHTHPFLNWKTLRERTLELLVNAPFVFSPLSAKEQEKREKEKEREKKDKERARAREIFFGGGNSRPRPRIGAGNADPSTMSQSQPPSRSYYRAELMEDQSGRPSTTSRKNGSGVPFFAALCAAIALGVLEAGKGKSANSTGDDEMEVDQTYTRSGTSRSKSSSVDPQTDAGYWYALSVQALGVWESAMASNSASTDPSVSPIENDREREKNGKEMKEGSQHDMDYMTACLLQIAFLAKDGLGICSGGDDLETGEERGYTSMESQGKRKNAKGVAAIVFPLVGKVLNYARQMELNKDPDDPGPPVASLSAPQPSEGPTSASTSTSTIPPPPGSTVKKFKNKLADPSQMVSNTAFSVSAARSKEPVYTLFEAEMRRRMWWTVVYYDLFVSDLMNQPPLISDTSFNTKLPVANVDEKVFGPPSIRIPSPSGVGEDGNGYSKDGFQYFEIRSRLTQLVRNVKRRMNTPEFGHGQQIRYSYYGASSSHGYSIDQAASMESEIRAWLGELPSCYQMDNDEERANEKEVDPILIAQRCEISITAHRLILKDYLPFLKKHAAGVPHQASLGSINAAHGVIRAAKVLADIWKSRGTTSDVPSSLSPAMFDFYPFPRAVFDAAVVCAHGVIKQPTTMWAAAAMEDVDTALEVLRSTCRSKFGSAVGPAFAVSAEDSIRLVEALKSKAEGGCSIRRTAHLTSSPSIPSKRKHSEPDELEEQRAPPPSAPAYVYPTIPSASPAANSEMESTPTTHQPPPPPPPVSAGPTPRNRQPPFPATNSELGTNRLKTEPAPSQSGDKDKKHAKKGRPAVGIRIRPSAKDGSPLAKQGLGLNTTTDTPTTPSSDRRSTLSATVPLAATPIESPSDVTPEQNGYPQPVQQTPQPSPFQPSVVGQSQMTPAVQEQVGYRSRSSSISQDLRLHARRQGSLSMQMDCTMSAYVTPESDQVHPMQHGVPEAHAQPSLSSLHPHPSYQHSSRPQQQNYGVVGSPVAYDTSQDTTSSVGYEFSYGGQVAPQHQETGTYDSYGSSQPPRKKSADVRSEGYNSSSSPYHSSNGPLSAASSPYTNTTAGTPNYGPQSSHQASPQNFTLQPPAAVNSTPPHHEYYAEAAVYEQSYATTTPAAVTMGDGMDRVEDSLVYEHVSYDVKPPIELLNQQQQLQHRQHQQVYQAYDTGAELSQHRQSQPHSHVWGSTPQLVEDNGQYWPEGGAVPESVYYVPS